MKFKAYIFSAIFIASVFVASGFTSVSESTSAVAMAAKDGQSPQEKYIAKYAVIAVSEMYRNGIPASITLAQGLLESSYGKSRLATEGNNHFGIKCHKWKGRKMYHDDDAKGECFRVYGSANESFVDHSDFLRYNDRYKFLFDYKITDYKSWAYGLKKAGYATDKAYPQKLIKYIEDYKLYEYDRMTVKQVEQRHGKSSVSKDSGKHKDETVTKTKSRKETRAEAKERKAREKAEAKAQKERAKAEAKAKKEAERAARREGWKNKWKIKAAENDFIDDSNTEIPLSPLAIEEAKKIDRTDANESYTFNLSRQLYSKNGVPFIYAVEGETIKSIADANNLFVRELLKFNDIKSDSELLPGSIVYLQQKKKQSAQGLDKYVIDHDGESLWEISQRFGVRLSSIYEMNDIDETYVPVEGDMINLRD